MSYINAWKITLKGSYIGCWTRHCMTQMIRQIGQLFSNTACPVYSRLFLSCSTAVSMQAQVAYVISTLPFTPKLQVKPSRTGH